MSTARQKLEAALETGTWQGKSISVRDMATIAAAISRFPSTEQSSSMEPAYHLARGTLGIEPHGSTLRLWIRRGRGDWETIGIFSPTELAEWLAGWIGAHAEQAAEPRLVPAGKASVPVDPEPEPLRAPADLAPPIEGLD